MRGVSCAEGIRSTLVADALPKDALDSAVKPSHVARQKFDLERRGFDQSQVRAYLIAVADSLRDAQDREAEMRSRLGKAVRRAERAEAAARAETPEDPSKLTQQLGEEVAAVLDAARVAGEQKVSAAEKSAEQLMTNAKTEATSIRKAAETIMDDRRAEADAAAEEILTACRAEADEILETARKDAALLRKDAAADVERARDEGDALIREAEEARVQILQDMDRRRRQARAQVERLRVGRDRLLRSYEVVRRTLDESTGELKSSLNEAKVMGDTAARRVVGEPLATPHQLEAEMADAKLIGRGQPETDRKRPGKSGGATSKAAKPSAKKADDSAEVKVPHVDLGPAGLQGDVAPSPRRPVVADTSVPKPPRTAPTIKAPVVEEPAEAPKELVAEAEQVDAEATAALPVPTLATAEATDAAEGATIVLEADEERPDANEDFKDLPEAELAVVEVADEIEEVVALVPEKMELDDREMITWVPTAPEDLEPVAEAPTEDAAIEADKADEADEADEVAEPSAVEAKPASSGLFAALRAQSGEPEAAPDEAEVAAEAATKAQADKEAAAKAKAAADKEAAAKAKAKAEKEAAAKAKAEEEAAAQQAAEEAAAQAAELARQRDAVIEEVTGDIEKRLKRALADEQNDVLAGIRAAGKKPVELIELVGETDDHVQRYVSAITEVAAQAYGAGAALVETEPSEGEMPAGAVEEAVGSAVVLPLRLRLLELDAMSSDSGAHIDAIRAFYRQRKTEYLGEAAASLAALLVTAGACDGLDADMPLPWLVGAH